MKKLISMILVLGLIGTIMTGCFVGEGDSLESNGTVTDKESSENTETDENEEVVEVDPNPTEDEGVEPEDQDTDPEDQEADPDQEDTNVQTDSGRYNGQADSNFIEISISGVPADEGTKVFMLSEDIKNNFDAYNLESGDNIRFEYVVDENEQMVITNITKL